MLNFLNIQQNRKADTLRFADQFQISLEIAQAYLEADDWLYYAAAETLRFDRKAGLI